MRDQLPELLLSLLFISGPVRRMAEPRLVWHSRLGCASSGTFTLFIPPHVFPAGPDAEWRFTKIATFLSSVNPKNAMTWLT